MKLDCIRVDTELIRNEKSKQAILDRVGLVGAGLQLKFLWSLNENLVLADDKEECINKWTKEVIDSLDDFSRTMVVLYDSSKSLNDKKAIFIFGIIENKIEDNILNGASLVELYVNNINMYSTAYKAIKEMMEHTYGSFDNFTLNIKSEDWYKDSEHIKL